MLQICYIIDVQRKIYELIAYCRRATKVQNQLNLRDRKNK